jgi:deazaflavin-dependent oxidoreductase (nitroreductase family)
VVLPRAESKATADTLILIGSKGGAKTDPDWVKNLRANPRVEVNYRKRTRAGVARELTGDAREQVWTATKTRAPIYAQYETTAAPRTIPVIEVTLDP